MPNRRSRQGAEALLLQLSASDTLLSSSSLPAASSPQTYSKLNLRRGTVQIAESLSGQFAQSAISSNKDLVPSSVSTLVPMGIVRPVKETLRFDQDDTFGRALLGPSFAKSLALFGFLASVWLAGAVAALLAIWHFVPIIYVYLGVLCFPLPAYGFLILNRPLFSLVMQQQQTGVFYFWTLVFFVAILFELRTQSEYLGVVMFMLAAISDMAFIPFSTPSLLSSDPS